MSFWIMRRLALLVITISLAACGGDNTNTAPADTTPPEVSVTAPVSGSVDIAVNSGLNVSFSEALDSTTVNDTSFTLVDDGASSVAGTVSYSDTVASFTPSTALAYTRSYTATVTTAITDKAGNALTSDYSFSFTTAKPPDTTAPSVVTVNPENGAVNVSADIVLQAILDEALYCSSVTTGTVTVVSTEQPVTGSVTCTGATIEFTPTSLLETNLDFTVTLTTGITDLASNPLAANYSWGFSTRPWTRQLGTVMDDYANKIAADSADNLYVTGYTTGDLGGVSAGLDDIYVAKYDKVGNLVWIRQLGTDLMNYAYDVAIDSADNVYVTGYTGGDLGGVSAGGWDVFIAKYDGDGALIWLRQFGTTGGDTAFAMTIDSADNVYVTGYTYGALGGVPAGGPDIFVAKYDSDGNQIWIRQLGTDTNDYGRGITVDSADNVYVIGHTLGALDGVSAGSYDFIVAKYDSTGNHAWTRQLGTSAYDLVDSITTDSTDNIYVAGHTQGVLGSALAGGYDLFITKYDDAGNVVWTRQQGTTTNDYARDITTDSTDNVYVTGTTQGALDGVSAGLDDSYVTKYDGTGNLIWSRQWGTSSQDRAYGITTDSGDNIYVTGDTSGAFEGYTSFGGWDLFVVKYSSAGVKR